MASVTHQTRRRSSRQAAGEFIDLTCETDDDEVLFVREEAAAPLAPQDGPELAVVGMVVSVVGDYTDAWQDEAGREAQEPIEEAPSPGALDDAAELSRSQLMDLLTDLSSDVSRSHRSVVSASEPHPSALSDMVRRWNRRLSNIAERIRRLPNNGFISFEPTVRVVRTKLEELRIEADLRPIHDRLMAEARLRKTRDALNSRRREMAGHGHSSTGRELTPAAVPGPAAAAPATHGTVAAAPGIPVSSAAAPAAHGTVAAAPGIPVSSAAAPAAHGTVAAAPGIPVSSAAALAAPGTVAATPGTPGPSGAAPGPHRTVAAAPGTPGPSTATHVSESAAEASPTARRQSGEGHLDPAVAVSGAGKAANAGKLACPVCFETVSKLRRRQVGFMVTRCGHWFCHPCLEQALKCIRPRQCPVCRQKLTRPSHYHKLFF